MNSIIGIFDNVASGIRYYCLQLQKEIGGEKIDMSGFYPRNYKGHRDSFKSSDKRLGFTHPVIVPKGDYVYFNIWDSRLTLAALPTLVISRALGKKIIGIVHHLELKENSIFNRLMPYWIFDSFILHSRAQKLKTKKPVVYRELTVYHEALKLGKNECRKRVGLPQGARIILVFGHIRPYKNIEKIAQNFIKTARKSDLLVIVGKKWYDIKLPKDNRIRLVEGFVPDEQVGMYFIAADRVAIAYGKEESAVYYLIRLYDKKVWHV